MNRRGTGNARRLPFTVSGHELRSAQGHMNLAETYKTRPRRRAKGKSFAAARRLTAAGCGILALAILSMSAANCPAAGAPLPAQAREPIPGCYCVRRANLAPDQRFDLVIVQAKGRGPQGFRFVISLLSLARAPESTLDLAAGESGVLVTARDVDGVGNDLDLVIKTAKSFAPIGVWINDHRGGFVKADSRIYAQSLWADGPMLLAIYPSDTIQGAVPAQIQPCMDPQPPAGVRHNPSQPNLIKSSILDSPLYRTVDPHKSRGPPSHC